VGYQKKRIDALSSENNSLGQSGQRPSQKRPKTAINANGRFNQIHKFSRKGVNIQLKLITIIKLVGVEHIMKMTQYIHDK